MRARARSIVKPRLSPFLILRLCLRRWALRGHYFWSCIWACLKLSQTTSLSLLERSMSVFSSTHLTPESSATTIARSYNKSSSTTITPLCSAPHGEIVVITSSGIIATGCNNFLSCATTTFFRMIQDIAWANIVEIGFAKLVSWRNSTNSDSCVVAQ